MFDLETILKGVALLVAVGLLFSSIDFSYILAKLTVKNDKPKVINKPVAPVVDQDSQFLKTLELWYMLKKQCDEAKLTEASKKMDEVFPLLNDNLEEG
jgi:hypothetical protein